jgi:hypothetical protein
VKSGSCNCSNFDANSLDDAGRAFRLLRQPSRPKPPRPLASGATAGAPKWRRFAAFCRHRRMHLERKINLLDAGIN